ncbi:MAG: class II fumarate hydratase [Deltaproteobacteria bacterium]|nr:class II fumarate hydratase [Deltaproteobacteria bacterium]
MTKMRTESDSMGEVKLPAEALYGATTKRAIENFKISGRPFPSLFIQMLGELKRAAAIANKALGLLDPKLADAITKAAEKVARGECQDHFPLDVFQTGSGTSTNMNANEVIANLANLSLGGTLGSKKPVHPNDHVNKGQSSNDVIPTVIHLAALQGIQKNLLPALKSLEKALQKKAKAFDAIVKIGRTHLMDATPIRLGQEFSGFAHQITESIERLARVLIPLSELAIGGTAVGTGINTHPEFSKKVCEVLSKRLGFTVREARNHFAAQAAKDACVEASGALKATAVAFMKIADDIRWLGSGPRAGLAEIILPELQPGSSIMPGKTNPVIPEVVCQVAAQVIGNDAAITWGGGLAKFELNTMMPLIAVNLLDSIELMTNAANVFTEKCIAGLQVNKKRCEELVEQSLMLSTPLAPHIGYDRAAKLAKKAAKSGKTIRQVALEEKVMSPKDLDRVLNVRSMTEPQK